MAIGSISSTALQQMLLNSINRQNGINLDSSSNDLTSLLLGSGDTSSVSSQGQLLSQLSSAMPTGVQAKINTLQSDLSSVDPSKLSDSDLTDFMSKLQSDLGSLPGSMNAFDPNNMSSDDLSRARSMLTDMKSMVSSLGQTGSMMAYTGMTGTQSANLAQLMQQVGSIGSTSGTSELSLLTSFNANTDSSDNSNTGLYSLLTSYNKTSMLDATGLAAKIAATEKSEEAAIASGSHGSTDAGSKGLDSADLNELFSSYLQGSAGGINSNSLMSLLDSYNKSSAGSTTTAPQSTIDYSV